MYCELLTGAAGCGKTFEIKRRIRENDLYGVMVSTTGVSAVNLGTTTINSLLSYFDTESLMDRYVSGKLAKRLYSIGKRVKNLVIDEISMMDGEQLDILYDGVMENNEAHPDAELGIVLTGDFCQLQPVKAKWAFQARCWPAFAENIVRMTRMYRQSDPTFLAALMFARQGKGKECMEIMREIVTFGGSLASDFDGTTVMGTNPKVDRFNHYALSKLPGTIHQFPSYRWGRTRGEWKYIPEILELKEGALVMILSNSPKYGSIITYACHNCGEELTENRYLQVVSKKVQLPPSSQVPAAEKEAQSLDNPKSPSPEVLQSELRVKVDKKAQSKVENSDAQTPEGELCGLEGREDSVKTLVGEETLGEGSKGIRVNSSTGAPRRDRTRIRVGTQAGNGKEIGSASPSKGTGTPQKWGEERQPTREFGVDKPSAAPPGENSVPVLQKGVLDSIGCPCCGGLDIRTSTRETVSFAYANGDLGHIVDLVSEKNSIAIKLIRNGSVVEIDLITRNFTLIDPPPRGTPTWDKKGEHDGSPYYDGPANRWVYGGITFYPIRLGYATTVHKTQSLTLDRVQVDFRDNFTGQPNMAYTALSRCKTPEGLRIIGTPELMAKRIKVHEEVLEWL